MRPNTLYCLAGLLFVSSVAMVQVRHQHRLAYIQLQEQEQLHDSLIDQWSQLLTEENLWAFPHRIEKDATSGLAMKKPAADEVIYIDMSGEPHTSGLIVDRGEQ